MKQVTQTIYSFSELSKKAQQTALNRYADINTDYDWWQFIYDDAKEIGIEITGFDIDRQNDIDIEDLTMITPIDVAENIIENHGEESDTYKAARKFLDAMTPIRVTEALLNEDYDDEELRQQFESDFSTDIMRCYWQMLYDDYQYRISDDGIIDTIIANDYEFYEDGTVYVHRKMKAA